MAATLQIMPHLHVTPLFDIQHPPFEQRYRDGVSWSLFREQWSRPMSDCSLLTNLRETLNSAEVDGQQGFWLPTIGFHFGRLHGAILSPDTGRPRPDVTALASFQHKEAARGYAIGREWYFTEAHPDERAHTYTDASLLDLLQQLERESVTFQDVEDTWYYALGSLLGELSGQLFPATSEDYAHWKDEDRRFWEAQSS